MLLSRKTVLYNPHRATIALHGRQCLMPSVWGTLMEIICTRVTRPGHGQDTAVFPVEQASSFARHTCVNAGALM